MSKSSSTSNYQIRLEGWKALTERLERPERCDS